MNDIAKDVISAKLRKACADENVSREKASELLGLKSKHYGAMIASANENQRKNVSAEAWERVQHWGNTGEKLTAYYDKYLGAMQKNEPSKPSSEIKPKKKKGLPGYENSPPPPPPPETIKKNPEPKMPKITATPDKEVGLLGRIFKKRKDSNKMVVCVDDTEIQVPVNVCLKVQVTIDDIRA